jgi:short-subunit dehydrogenase
VISIAGYIGLPGRTAYSASKFAVRGFLETLRAENRKNGLHVLVTAPGFVASEIRLHALDAKGRQQNESPRDEKKMMTAEQCARKIYRAIRRRKREQIMGWGEGKLAVALSKWYPRLVEWASYRKMSREPGSPFF